MLVKALRGHGNAYGPVFAVGDGGGFAVRAGEAWQKREADLYVHPDPAQLIEAGLVERADRKSAAAVGRLLRQLRRKPKA